MLARIPLVACIVRASALRLQSTHTEHDQDLMAWDRVQCTLGLMEKGHSVDRSHTIIFTSTTRYEETGLAWEITRQYCERWQYSCQYFTKRLLNNTYSTHFDRYAILQEILQDTDVRTVLWMDDDSFVYDFDTPIEKWLEKYPDQDVIMGNVTRDQSPQAPLTLNSGAMLFRNTAFVKRFLNDILEDQACKPWWHRSDQFCIQALIKKKTEYQDHFALIPSQAFNCQDEAIHNVGGHCDPWIFHTHGAKRCLIPVARKFIDMGCSKIDIHESCD